MIPTQEQIEIVEAVKSGVDVIVQALSGSGKTSTLYLAANAISNKKILYLAFNKAIVEEATSKMPSNVECRTIHSVAYRNSDKEILKKLTYSQNDNKHLSSMLSLKGFNVFDSKNKETIYISPFRLIGWVNRTVQHYMQSDKDNISLYHVYIDPDYEHLANNVIKDAIFKAACKLWKMYIDTSNTLRIPHDVYLKLFALSGIDVGYDVVLVDESQDVSPVMLSILRSQKSSQKVYVGDKHQKIYSFTGSIDIAAKVTAKTLYLSKSFRFGQLLADEANVILDKLKNEVPLKGTEDTFTFDEVKPNAIICRTNSGVLSRYIIESDSKMKINISCDTASILHFAECLIELDEKGKTIHKYLNGFKSSEQFYSWLKKTDEDLDLDLLQLASICRKNHPASIIHVLSDHRQHSKPDLVITTAHKSKGLEWDNVELGGDFPDPYYNENDEEKRLFYVAMTRAKSNLYGLEQYKKLRKNKKEK